MYPISSGSSRNLRLDICNISPLSIWECIPCVLKHHFSDKPVKFAKTVHGSSATLWPKYGVWEIIRGCPLLRGVGKSPII